MLVPSHLIHIILLILLVQISNFWETHLVAAVLILDFIEIVLASPDDVYSVVSSVTYASVTADAN